VSDLQKQNSTTRTNDSAFFYLPRKLGIPMKMVPSPSAVGETGDSSDVAAAPWVTSTQTLLSKTLGAMVKSKCKEFKFELTVVV
jgi:hypothetical protein